MSKAQTLGCIKSPSICFLGDGNLSCATHLEGVPYMAVRSPASLPYQTWVIGWDRSQRGRSMNTACHYIKRWSQVPCIWGIAGIGTPSVQETGLCLGKTPLGAWCLTCQVISCLWCVPWLGREHGFLVIRQTQVPFSAQGLEAACVPHPCFHKRLRRGFLTVYHRARTTQQSQSE